MTALSDMAMFTRYTRNAYAEALQDKIVDVAQRSGGAIEISMGNEMEGSFRETSTYNRVTGLVKHRDPYSDAAISTKTLSQRKGKSVKIGRGTPMMNLDESSYDWLNLPASQAGIIFGEMLAEQDAVDMVNTATGVLLTCLRQEPNFVVTPGGPLTYSALNAAQRVFGDNASKIAGWLTHSTPYFDLYGQNISNTEGLFRIGDVSMVSDPMGRPIVVSDLNELITAGTPDVYSILGLRPGAVTIKRNNDFRDNYDRPNGKANISTTYQAQWSYELSVSGYEYNSANGGESPVDAALRSAASWDRSVEQDKNLPGVVLNVTAAP